MTTEGQLEFISLDHPSPPPEKAEDRCPARPVAAAHDLLLGEIVAEVTLVLVSTEMDGSWKQ